MAKVPVFNAKTKNTLSKRAALPNVRITDNTTAATFGGNIGAAMDSLADQTMGLAETQHKREVQEQQRKEAVQVNEAVSTYEISLDESLRGQTGALNLSGKAAVEAVPETLKSMAKRREQISRHLTGNAKKLFMQQTASIFRSGQAELGRHTAQQQQAWESQNVQANIARYRDDAIKQGVKGGQYQTGQITLKLTLGVSEIGEQAKQEGWSPEKTDHEQRTYVSSTHLGIVKHGLVTGTWQNAELYVRANRHMFSGEDLVEAKRLVEDGRKNAIAMESADRLWDPPTEEKESDYKYVGPTTDERYAAAMARAEEEPDPEIRANIMSRLAIRHRRVKKAERARKREIWGGAVTSVIGGTAPGDLPEEIRRELGPEKMGHLGQLAKTGGDHETSVAGQKRIRHLLNLSDAELVETDLTEYVHMISISDMDKLKIRRTEAQKRVDGNLDTYDTLNPRVRKHLSATLTAVGLAGNGAGHARGRFRLEVASALAREVANGKIPTPEREREIIRRTMAETASRRVVNAGEYYTGGVGVPQPDHDLISRRFIEKVGRAPTEQEIQNIFLREYDRKRASR